LIWQPNAVALAAHWTPSLPECAKVDSSAYGSAAKVIVQYAERQAISGAVGPGCFTDTTPPWIVEQSIHQPGETILISSLLDGDSEPAVIDENIIAGFDRSVSALTAAPVTRLGQLSHSWTHDEVSRAVVGAPRRASGRGCCRKSKRRLGTASSSPGSTPMIAKGRGVWKVLSAPACGSSTNWLPSAD
jgi:hypothetical protein